MTTSRSIRIISIFAIIMVFLFLINSMIIENTYPYNKASSDNISDTRTSENLPSSSALETGKMETFFYAGLKLEISNVRDIQYERMVDDGGHPWEYKIYVCNPGASIYVLNADMSDVNFSADGKSHANWGMLLSSGKRMEIVDGMKSIKVTRDTLGIYSLESSLYVLKLVVD